MTPPDALFDRIRGEYREMPGLRLTLPQACRLWDLDRQTCEGLLEQLVRDDFLWRTPAGAYLAFPSRARPARATLPPAPAGVRRA